MIWKGKENDENQSQKEAIDILKTPCQQSVSPDSDPNPTFPVNVIRVQFPSKD